MPVYQRGRSKDKWRVRLRRDGRIVVDETVAGSRKDAEAVEALRKVELAQGRPVREAVTAPRFRDFILETFKPHAQAHLKPTTWSKQSYILAELISHFGDIKLSALSLAMVEAYIRKRQADGVGPVTINNELRVLHRVLAHAAELGLPVSIPKWRKLRQRSSRAVTHWTEDEIGRLLAACATEAPDLLPILVCLANTGMRVGEALALTWEDVDLGRGVIRVQYHPEDGWSPKTDRWREVPVNDHLMPFLLRPRRSDKWVFPCASTGDRWSEWPQRKFDKVRKAAGVSGGVHLFRHSYASHFLRQVPDLFLLGKVLGHSHTRTTALYSHLLPDSMARVRDAVAFGAGVSAAEAEAAVRWRGVRP